MPSQAWRRIGSSLSPRMAIAPVSALAAAMGDRNGWARIFDPAAQSENGAIAEKHFGDKIDGSFAAEPPRKLNLSGKGRVTAASIVSENKQLCTPSSVDSIVSSNGQEDHVSMGANGATKCLRVLNNLEKILAIELLTAAQALEFRRPLRSSEMVEKFILDYRKHVFFNEKDRFLAVDIQKTISFIQKKIKKR